MLAKGLTPRHSFARHSFAGHSLTRHSLKPRRPSLSSLSEAWRQGRSTPKRGNIYIKSTSRNLFCSLLDVQTKKVITSCSLRVPRYENEFNEKEDLYKRGVLLGELFGAKSLELGFRRLSIHLDMGANRLISEGRRGVVHGLGQKKIRFSFIRLAKAYPHNGCRPPKVRRKKRRTKARRT